MAGCHADQSHRGRQNSHKEVIRWKHALVPNSATDPPSPGKSHIWTFAVRGTKWGGEKRKMRYWTNRRPPGSYFRVIHPPMRTTSAFQQLFQSGLARED